jgi:hypothetical protein
VEEKKNSFLASDNILHGVFGDDDYADVYSMLEIGLSQILFEVFRGLKKVVPFET